MAMQAPVAEPRHTLAVVLAGPRAVDEPCFEGPITWERACASYRAGVAAYKRAVRIHQQRLRAHRAPPRPVAAGAQAEQAFGCTTSVTSTASATLMRATEQCCGLTRRELDVARLLARGLSNELIAQTLVVERGTVANHVAHILGKLELRNRTQVAAWFIANQRN